MSPAVTCGAEHKETEPKFEHSTAEHPCPSSQPGKPDVVIRRPQIIGHFSHGEVGKSPCLTPGRPRWLCPLNMVKVTLCRVSGPVFKKLAACIFFFLEHLPLEPNHCAFRSLRHVRRPLETKLPAGASILRQPCE